MGLRHGYQYILLDLMSFFGEPPRNLTPLVRISVVDATREGWGPEIVAHRHPRVQSADPIHRATLHVISPRLQLTTHIIAVQDFELLFEK
jgi:hypothetical protein